MVAEIQHEEQVHAGGWLQVSARVNCGEPRTMTLEEAVRLDEPEGTVHVMVSAKLLVRLIESDTRLKLLEHVADHFMEEFGGD